MPLQNAKILQVLPALNNGGVERGTLEVAEAIIESGGQAFVASNGGKLEASLKRIGAKHVSMPLQRKSPLAWRQNQRQLQNFCTQNDIQVIHARSRAPAWPAYFAAKSLGVPFVTTYHGVYSSNNFIKKYYNSVMTRGAPVIAVSKFVHQHILKEYPQLKNNIIVIARGVDVALFNVEKVTPDQRNVLKKAWGLKENIPLLLFPGRISRWKGQQESILALSTLKHLEWQAVFLGNGSPGYALELKKLTRQYDLQQRVIWADTIQDMPAAYSLANLVICPSTRPEAFGRTVIEAQAMQTPVIATNHGGAAETIQHGVTGFHIPPHTNEALFVDDLATSIRQIMQLNTAHLTAVTDVAFKNVRENYTTKTMTDAVIDVYKSCIC